MNTEWGNEFLLHFTVIYLIFLIDDVHFASVSVHRITVVRIDFFFAHLSILSISLIRRSLP